MSSFSDISSVNLQPSLYISDAQSAQSKRDLQKLGITRVVSVGYQFKPVHSDMTYHLIQIDDDEEEFLLPHLPAALDFIHSAITSGTSVLVHCAAGVSRSASIVIAYLMRTHTLGFKQAWESLRETRPIVSPNLGFQFQLVLFEEMKCALDNNYQKYKRMKLTALAKEREERGFLKQIDYGVQAEAETTNYRCRKCRSLLATQNNVVDHEVGAGQSAFDWRRRTMMGTAFFGENSPHRKIEAETSSCSSVFVEPMSWIKGISEGQLDGQILCPKCESKLGSFNWVGTQCSCGCWVAPAFVLHRSKIDLMKK